MWKKKSFKKRCSVCLFIGSTKIYKRPPNNLISHRFWCVRHHIPTWFSTKRCASRFPPWRLETSRRLETSASNSSTWSSKSTTYFVPSRMYPQDPSYLSWFLVSMIHTLFHLILRELVISIWFPRFLLYFIRIM